MSRCVYVYKTYENGESELIARAASPFKAIEIAAEHHDDVGRGIISIGSEQKYFAAIDLTKAHIVLPK